MRDLGQLIGDLGQIMVVIVQIICNFDKIMGDLDQIISDLGQWEKYVKIKNLINGRASLRPPSAAAGAAP
jgi:hypothetical protein